MGITPYDNQSGFSFLYRYKSFNGYSNMSQKHELFPRTYTSSGSTVMGQQQQLRHGSHGSATTAEPVYRQEDYEIYTTAELRGKYFIHQRIELNGIVPYILNQSLTSTENISVKGIGDITLFAGYHLVNKTLTDKVQHRLILGGGIKLPVADYYLKDENGKRIDPMLQPGTGSVDYLVYSNYVAGYKKLGLSTNITYKINGSNYYKEKINNSLTSYLNIFYKFREAKQLKVFPSLQGYYENTNGMYKSGAYLEGTRVEVITGGIGFDVFYKNISLNTSFQLPVYEKKTGNYLSTAGKFMIGITYSFNQKKYLLK